MLRPYSTHILSNIAVPMTSGGFNGLQWHTDSAHYHWGYCRSDLFTMKLTTWSSQGLLEPSKRGAKEIGSLGCPPLMIGTQSRTPCMHDEKEIEREIYPSWKRFYNWVNTCDNGWDPYGRVSGFASDGAQWLCQWCC
jgi:hypothetical protein